MGARIATRPSCRTEQRSDANGSCAPFAETDRDRPAASEQQTRLLRRILKKDLLQALLLSRELPVLAIKTTRVDREDSGPSACACPPTLLDPVRPMLTYLPSPSSLSTLYPLRSISQNRKRYIALPNHYPSPIQIAYLDDSSCAGRFAYQAP
jgi:hypothetical protein